MLLVYLVNGAISKLRKGKNMNPRSVKMQRKTICPSCHVAVQLRPGKEPLSICPQCGEWIVNRGHGRRAQRWDDVSERGSWEDADGDRPSPEE